MSIGDFYLMLWAHSPVFALTNDDKFLEVKKGDLRNDHLRFSLINICFGKRLFQFFSVVLKMEPEGIKFVSCSKWLFHISELDNCSAVYITENEVENKRQAYMEHLSELDEKEIGTEKEALLIHLERQKHRMDTAITKADIYCSVIFGALPIFITVSIGKIIAQGRYSIILLIILAYCLVNCMAFSLSIIGINSFTRSRFMDIKNSEDKLIEFLTWMYYDWQRQIKDSSRFVSYLMHLRRWMLFSFVISIILAFVIK